MIDKNEPYTDKFLLTRPLRGATRTGAVVPDARKISTHTPLAGRDTDAEYRVTDVIISTHTPLAGRDSRARQRATAPTISTHTPLAGRDSTTKVSG